MSGSALRRRNRPRRFGGGATAGCPPVADCSASAAACSAVCGPMTGRTAVSSVCDAGAAGSASAGRANGFAPGFGSPIGASGSGAAAVGWPASSALGRMMRRMSPLIVGQERSRRRARTSEYRYRPAAAGPPARPRRRAPPCGRRRTAPRGRGPRRAGRPPRGTGRSAARQRPASHGSQNAPSIPPSATGWMPTGVANAGTSQASASITESPKPSSWLGTSTAFGGVDPVRHLVGRDAAHRQELRARRRLLRAVEALQRPRRVVREEQVAARRGRGRAARGPPRAGSGGSAPARCPRAAPRPAASCRRRGGSGRTRARRPPGAR